MKMRVSQLIRNAKEKYIKETKYKNDIKAINRFIAFLLKEYSNDIFIIDNRNANQYIRGVFHGFIFFLILILIFKR